MADSAILAAGGGNAPLHYRVPGASVIRIKQVHVHYTDNSAGADWLPMVRIVSDSGHTMGQAADQAVKVAAGDDAAVTFHPGVKHAATSGGLTKQSAYAILALSSANYGDPAFTVASGATPNVRFPHQNNSDSVQFAFSPSTTYSDTIILRSTDYIYQAFASVQWVGAGYSQQSTIIGPSPFLDGTFITGALDNHGETPTNTFTVGGPFVGVPWWAVDERTFLLDTAPQNLTLNVFHDSGTSKDIFEASLLCLAYKVF